MPLASSTYSVGTQLRILTRSRSRAVEKNYTGEIGIVSYIYTDGDVSLTRNGNEDDTDDDNQLGYYSFEEVEPVENVSDTFQEGNIVVVNAYRKGDLARVVAWPSQWGTREKGRTAVVFLQNGLDTTNYGDHHLRLASTMLMIAPIYVGVRYWPTTNEHARCLNDPNYDYALAGNESKPGEFVEIVLEPIEAKVGVYGKEVDAKIVVVKCLRGHYHQVLFDERGLQPPS